MATTTSPKKNVIQSLIDAYDRSNREWHEKEATRRIQERYGTYRSTYYDVCRVVTPVLQLNASVWDIVSPEDPSMVVAEPPLYYDRGSIFYTLVVRRSRDHKIHGSRLKRLMNTQLTSYCEFHQYDLLWCESILLSKLKIVAIGDEGDLCMLYIGRTDDPATLEYIQAQEVRRRHPGERNMI